MLDTYLIMLDRKKKYLQIALNSTPEEGEEIISQLPQSDRIIIEAGTPLIKDYGKAGIRRLVTAWRSRLMSVSFASKSDQSLFRAKNPGIYAGDEGNSEARKRGLRPLDRGNLFGRVINYQQTHKSDYLLELPNVNVVADTKCMDRGLTEVQIAAVGGASAATVLGAAPIETINAFITACKDRGLDSMVDMMGVEQPIKVLRKLKQMPTVVILHRGVDEEAFDKNKPIPYLQINKIRSSFNTMISIAGGDTIREAQRAVFNDANIVIVWKDFYSPVSNTSQLAEEFLKEIK